jgi:hypothetical protein
MWSQAMYTARRNPLNHSRSLSAVTRYAGRRGSSCLVHPCERTAAEIAAMWREPGCRPLVEIGGRERGRLLWSLGVLVVLAWTAALFLWPWALLTLSYVLLRLP